MRVQELVTKNSKNVKIDLDIVEIFADSGDVIYFDFF